MFRKNFQNQIRNVSIRNFRSTFKAGREYETIKLERMGQLSGRAFLPDMYMSKYKNLWENVNIIVRSCENRENGNKAKKKC